MLISTRKGRFGVLYFWIQLDSLGLKQTPGYPNENKAESRIGKYERSEDFSDIRVGSKPDVCVQRDEPNLPQSCPSRAIASGLNDVGNGECLGGVRRVSTDESARVGGCGTNGAKRRKTHGG
ncbi:hypothetical protein THF1C08_10209 [Vibrio jasicida]|uniref:Uncharacterized protein n=1 Tax=Vibrio jasicida TaxID=766224 RepID=A0AAU9QER7_9VIBR|nr:hypothetical protein THF1C08_10209 [Vibrio jasicida]CAH1563807.1 hypothetical protein THF1A12_10208 [Vibrio jasicida]